MKCYKTENLRNVGFIGHSDSGKTTLAEAILFFTKTIDRFGKIEDETTTSDYDIEERKRKISIGTSILPCEWKNFKINVLDTPGYFDFVGELIQILNVIDIGVITVSGRSGVKVGTEKSWEMLKEKNIPSAFFINKLDVENSNFEKVLSQLKDRFSSSIVSTQYPIGVENSFTGIIDIISKKAKIFNNKTSEIEELDIPKELINKVEILRKELIEVVAATDEELLEYYFEKETLTNEQIYKGLKKGIESGEITPVFCGSAYKGMGISDLLENMIKLFPHPRNIENILNTNKREEKLIVDENKPFSAQVFKTIADPFVGKLSIFKVITGKAMADSLIYNVNNKKEEKLSSLYFLCGKNQKSTNKIIAGDIGAVGKLQCTNTGDTLVDKDFNILFDKIKFPKPVISMAIIPKGKGDEEKIYSGLNKLLDEDLTLELYRDYENGDIIVSGMGETHLDIIVSKLKNKFGVNVELQLPKIPYRETIKSNSDVQGKHKKQSGGHGQYGDVKIKFQSRLDGEYDLQFENKIVGGSVPKQYIPAVEKSLKENMKVGVLAGYPVIGVKATLYDGSYHPVDSSEMAFKIATSLAYKKGIKEASPILLEPIMDVEINFPLEFMGEIISDINKRRGKVLGMDKLDKFEKVIAEIPMSEMLKYATDLRSITGGMGNFYMKFKKYEPLSFSDAEKIINLSKIKK